MGFTVDLLDPNTSLAAFPQYVKYYRNVENWTDNKTLDKTRSKMKSVPRSRLPYNLHTRNFFQRKSYDQIANATNQLYSSKVITRTSLNFMQYREVAKKGRH